MKKVMHAVMTLLSSAVMLFTMSTVNSACSFWIYEEPMPDKAKKLIKE